MPKPFNLSTSSKRKVDEPPAYVSMAQQIERYQKQTPDRYHLRSRKSQERGEQETVQSSYRKLQMCFCLVGIICMTESHGYYLSGPSRVKSEHMKLTQPHTPELMTRQRSRPPTVKSSSELEAEEVERLNK